MPLMSFLSSRANPVTARRAVAYAALEALEDRRLLSVGVVSVVNGASTLGNGVSREPSVSEDGRFIAFSSSASNLVANDTNGVSDVFVHDTQTGQTILISANTGGAAGNGASDEPSISADGRFVSFRSVATDLIANDSNSLADIFVRDVQAGTTRRVSADSSGPNFTGNSNGASAEPFTSANGDFVAFTSRATDMVNGVTDRADAFLDVGQTGNVNDVFLRDLTSGNPGTAVRMVSVNTSGNVSGNAKSFDASVSADGRFVAFRSDASDLVSGDNNGKRDIFVRDMQAGVTTRVSVPTGGGEGNGDSDSPSISQDGRYVTFSSMATNLVGNDSNGKRDVFVHDRNTSTTTLVSVNQLRTASGNGTSFEPTISQEGRFIAFTSDSSDLTTGDNNNSSDIFLYDINTGTLTLLSVNLAGRAAQGNSRDAFVSPGGRFIAFSSEAIDLVGGDNNNTSDAFLATAPSRENDAIAPTASVATGQPSNFLGGTNLDFIVTYNDNDAIATTSLGDGDVQITPPNGTPVAATFVSSVGSGKAVNATYRIFLPPGETVSAANNGAYDITMVSGQVTDAAGNAVAAGSIGQVAVNAVNQEGPDLVITIPTTLPPQVAGFKGKQKVFIQNTGTVAVAGKIGVSLFLSADPLLDPSDTQIVTKTVNFRGKPNAKPKAVAFKFLWPSPGPANTAFQLLAAVDTTNIIAERNEQNNVASTPVTVADPFVDLSGALGAVPTPLTAGQRVKVPFTIQNNGNVPARGAITLRLLASRDDVLDASDTEIITLPKRVSLRPGKPRLMPLTFTVPSTLAAGDYRLLVQIDSGGAIDETNETNNVVVSEDTFSV